MTLLHAPRDVMIRSRCSKSADVKNSSLMTLYPLRPLRVYPYARTDRVTDRHVYARRETPREINIQVVFTQHITSLRRDKWREKAWRHSKTWS